MKSKLDYYILNDYSVGFEFEFYTKFKPDRLVGLLKENFKNKEILVEWKLEVDKTGKQVKKIKSKSETKPDKDQLKLEIDLSGGDKMYELITGPMNFYESQIILNKALKFIEVYGYTTDFSGIHLNVSKKNTNLGSINLIKFILDFDEERIYKVFPERRNNVFAATIKNLRFRNIFKNSAFNRNNINNFVYVYQDKYYGVNFTKMVKNYLEVRYMGGEDYQKKEPQIQELMLYFVWFLEKQLKDSTLTKDNLDTIEEKFEKESENFKKFHDPEEFQKNFPDIELTVDLKDNIEVIKTFYNRFDRVLWDLIINYNLDKCAINYDTDLGRLQIKGANITNAIELSELDIIDSKFKGHGNHLSFWNCEIEGSIIEECQLYGSNYTMSAKVVDCLYGKNNEFEQCYIFSNDPTHEINGTFKNCVLRKGRFSEELTMDDECILVEEI